MKLHQAVAPGCYISWVSYISYYLNGCFLKWWVSPTNPWVFLLKMIILGCFGARSWKVYNHSIFLSLSLYTHVYRYMSTVQHWTWVELGPNQVRVHLWRWFFRYDGDMLFHNPNEPSNVFFLQAKFRLFCFNKKHLSVFWQIDIWPMLGWLDWFFSAGFLVSRQTVLGQKAVNINQQLTFCWKFPGKTPIESKTPPKIN